jgi:hypothetical protein
VTEVNPEHPPTQQPGGEGVGEFVRQHHRRDEQEHQTNIDHHPHDARPMLLSRHDRAGYGKQRDDRDEQDHDRRMAVVLAPARLAVKDLSQGK